MSSFSSPKYYAFALRSHKRTPPPPRPMINVEITGLNRTTVDLASITSEQLQVKYNPFDVS